MLTRQMVALFHEEDETRFCFFNNNKKKEKTKTDIQDDQS